MNARLIDQWLHDENVRPLIVKVLPDSSDKRWHMSCPGHGGTGHPTWRDAQIALERHLGQRWLHPEPQPEPIATILPRTLAEIRARRAARAIERNAS